MAVDEHTHHATDERETILCLKMGQYLDTAQNESGLNTPEFVPETERRHDFLFHLMRSPPCGSTVMKSFPILP